LRELLFVSRTVAVGGCHARADRGGLVGVTLGHRGRGRAGGGALGAQRVQDLAVSAGLAEHDRESVIGLRAAAGRAQRLGQGGRHGGTDGAEQRELAGGLGPLLKVGLHRCGGVPSVTARGVALAPAAGASAAVGCGARAGPARRFRTMNSALTNLEQGELLGLGRVVEGVASAA
jgi:hypothetical protein